VSSRRAGLHSFVPLEQTSARFWRGHKAREELDKRGYTGRFEPRYRNPSFRLEDRDFPEEIWDHWEGLAAEDNTVWGKIAETILMGPDCYWSGHLASTVTEIASNGSTRRVIRDGLAPLWICKSRCPHQRAGLVWSR